MENPRARVRSFKSFDPVRRVLGHNARFGIFSWFHGVSPFYFLRTMPGKSS